MTNRYEPSLARWLADNGVTDEEAAKAGLDLETRRATARRQARTLTDVCEGTVGSAVRRMLTEFGGEA